MTVKEYLTKIGISESSSKNLCFVVGEVINITPSTKEIYYRTSPRRTIWEWFESLNHSADSESNVLNFNVLNTKQPVVSWLSGVDWNPGINNGHCISLLVMSKKELTKYYPKTQWERMERYIDTKIKEEISNLRINQALSCM